MAFYNEDRMTERLMSISKGRIVVLAAGCFGAGAFIGWLFF